MSFSVPIIAAAASDIAHQHRFGDLSSSAVAGRRFGEHGGDALARSGLRELQRRQVHAHAQLRQAGVAPGAGLCAGGAQQPSRRSAGSARSPASGMNSAGETMPSPDARGAQQRLGADDARVLSSICGW